MKVLIIGAGAVGSVIAKKLSSDSRISEVTTASRERAHHGTDINRIRLDASDNHALNRASKGADLIINASIPDLNTRIMRAALKAGANYQDTCSHLKDLIHPEQLKYHSRFNKAGLIALINTGLAPGVTNLLAREVSERLDRVDDVKIRLLEEQESDKFIFTWSKKVTLDLLNLPAIIYRNGRIYKKKQFSEPEMYPFPKPFGIRNTYAIYGDEVTTIPRYIKLKRLDYKSGGEDIEIAKRMVESGRKPDLKKDIPPPDKMRELVKNGVIKNAAFVSSVEARGTFKGKRRAVKMTAGYPTIRQIPKTFSGSSYIAYPTGVACSAFAAIIPKIKRAGVFPPEALNAAERRAVTKSLRKNDVELTCKTIRS